MGYNERPIRVSIAGSTGSIGTQALEVVRAAPDRFQVAAISAGHAVDALAQQAWEFRPSVVAIADASARRELSDLLPPGTCALAGEEGTDALVDAADVVLNAVVGFAGLPVTLAALRFGRRLALANKESLVAAGALVKDALRSGHGEIVPVDSEHCAIHQCLSRAGGGASEGAQLAAPARLIITASGGPFRGRTRAELGEVSASEALAHPTWAMGPMNTVNSSTLMNKGLEVIEASLLFDVAYEKIEVLVHPQSVVHSMVEFSDGATLAQLSLPDMRLPIGYALSYPIRLDVPFGPIDWTVLGRLDFEQPDRAAFPCLDLAYEAGKLGGTAPTRLNAANEIAVDAFLNGSLRWVDIPSVIEKVLVSSPNTVPQALKDVLEADAEARALARAYV